MDALHGSGQESREGRETADRPHGADDTEEQSSVGKGAVQSVRIVTTAVSRRREDHDGHQLDISAGQKVLSTSQSADSTAEAMESSPVPVVVQSSTCIRLSVSGTDPSLHTADPRGSSSSNSSVVRLQTSHPASASTEDRTRKEKGGGQSPVSAAEEEGSVSVQCLEMSPGEDLDEQTGQCEENNNNNTLMTCGESCDAFQHSPASDPHTVTMKERLLSQTMKDRLVSQTSDCDQRFSFHDSEVADTRGKSCSSTPEDCTRHVPSDAGEGPASSRPDSKPPPGEGEGGQTTFRSQVVMRLASGGEGEGEGAPPSCSQSAGREEGGRVGASGLDLVVSSTSHQQSSQSWEQEPSDDAEGAGRGKRTDANGSGGLGLKEVEFKLDIGKRRLPSPDVKRASAEKERTPEFVVKPRRQFVDEGQNAKFKVAFEGSPAPRLSWSRNGKPLEASRKFKMYEDSGYHFLEVCDVTQSDSGMYVGTIHNTAGTDTASAELDVFEKPKLLTRGSPPPTLSSSLQDMDVVIGDRDIKLQCEVTGADNRCTVTWFHNGREVRQGRQHRCVFNGKTASLTLTEVGEEDGGEYQCVIKNANGEVVTSCTLSTQEGEKREPPVFIKELQDLEVEDGDKVELIVEVKDSDLDQEAEP